MSRSVAYPILAFLVVVLAATANLAVFAAGQEWFVRLPPIDVLVRNVAVTAAILAGGWLLMPAAGRTRGAETFLLVAAALFSIGSAVQFRLGFDAPPQLSNNQITAVRDSLAAHTGLGGDALADSAQRVVRRRDGELRRNFEASRIDTRLARALEHAYGDRGEFHGLLESREVASGDPIYFRLLPLLALLLTLGLVARGKLAALLSARWVPVGFIGSLVICLGTLAYLLAAGGVRGANLAPQELLKLTLPIAWAGLLIHYRAAFGAGPSGGPDRARFARSPLVLWLYTLMLLSSPLVVFLLVRDFGQFLVISIAQTLLLAYFTRSALYVVLFLAGTLASSAILLGSDLFPGTALLAVLAIVVAAVVAIGALERFRRRDVFWTSASLVLALYVGIAYLAVQLPFIARMLATPRQRFLLWADLYSRRGDAHWWDTARQIVESLYAFDAGGLTGHGLGLGTPFLIPKAASDFVFAAIAEELGFAGSALVILSFATLTAIGLRIASNLGRDSYAGLVVAGYTLLLAAQAFVHIAGTMNILPMTGITLPLVSSGMSSLVVSWGIVGMVLGLSTRNANEGSRLVIVKRQST